MTRKFLTAIQLPADPTAALEAATKQYVDATAGGTGNVLAFGFNATTTEAPTGNQVRLNNATQTAATLIWISQTTWDGLDVTLGLGRILAGYQIYMQDFNDSTKWLLFNVTAAGTDKGSYWEFPITYNSGPGGIPAAKMALQSITPASHGIPSGGADGDVLTKTSGSDYAAAWETPTGGGGAAVGTKLTALTAMGSASNGSDIIEVVDVSDTTMAASGTNKKLMLSELVGWLNANGITVVDASTTVKGVVELATTAEATAQTDNVRAVTPLGLADRVPTGRTLTTTAPITIGGAGSADLSANRTLALAADGVTNTYLAQMPTLTIKGNNTAGTAGPQDLTVAQTRSMVASGAGAFFGFDFDTTTTAGAAVTRLRLNNATPASATIVYVSYTSKDGVDLKTRLLAGTAGDRLYIQDRANSANYRVYELTGAPTDSTTYATCNVVHRAGGGSLWANSAEIIAGFTSAPFTVGTAAPSAPLIGDLWVDTT